MAKMKKEIPVIEPIEFLAASRLFSGFSKEKLMRLKLTLEPSLMEYKKNDVAISENTAAYKLALITDGKFIATKLTNDGGKRIFRIHMQGDLLGLEACKSSFGTWPHTYTCDENGGLLWFNIEPLLAATGTMEEIEDNLKLRDNIENILADLAVRLHYHTDVLSTSPLRDRLMLHLTYMSDKHSCDQLELHMNRTQLAGYLSVDRSTLSRELQSMKSDGLIETKGESTFIILRNK